MKEISNADYDQIKRILRSLSQYDNINKLKRDEARRKARLLLRKYDRKDSTKTKE